MALFKFFSIIIVLICTLTTKVSAEDVCQIDESFKLSPNIDFDEVARACDWEFIFKIGDYFSLEGLMNGLFDKIKNKANAGICKITSKDIWSDNEDLIGYKWPGDVTEEVAKEIDDELDAVTKSIVIPGIDIHDIGAADIDVIHKMLSIN